MGLIRFFATFRPAAGGGTVEVAWSPGDPVINVIRSLLSLKPGLEGLIVDQDEQLLPYVGVFLNGRDIRHLNGLDTAVDGEAEIAIFPPVAGG